MTQSHILLREYTESGSESAFRQLVEQYVDLVFSTALRRLAGDRHRAEDAAQIVFTDLARKAKSLPPDVMLGGWLHRHCCFVVSNMCRADSRRAAREKEAVAMETLHGENADCPDVAPQLDEAINSLQQEDRDAIVLRFFERQDFRAIGEAIGGSENAAQKRVARALEKLRQSLAAHGVALSVTALMTALASQAVASAPATLAQKASTTALKNAGAKAAAVAGGTGGLAIAIWVIAAAAVIGGIGAVISRMGTPESAATESRLVADQFAASPNGNRAASAQPNKTSANNLADAQQMQEIATPTGPTLRLTIVADDSGKPVPNVPIEYRAREGNRWVDKNLQCSRAGVALVPFTEDTSELRLITRTEMFADTRLFWQTKDSPIPPEYTLRLKRGVRIGGKVINSRGELVPGATVHFGMPMEDPELAQKTESHEIGGVNIVAEDGTWQTMRITEPGLRRMHADASHPDYAGTEPPHSPMLGNEVERFLKGTHVFTLRDGTTVRGIVVNTRDEAIGGAKILIGGVHVTGSREGTADGDGRFEITGCTPGGTTLTASANGYGAKTVRVDSPPEESYRVVLERGRLLKMRIVNTAGQPIPKAYAFLKTLDGSPEAQKNPLVQVDFDKRSDEEGRIEWDEAPADELTFDFDASGYMRKVEQKVAADGVEHTIALLSALKISGTVRDEATGKLIPKFRVIAGYPESYIPAGETKPVVHWSTIARHWLQGIDGKFEEIWGEPIVFGVPENKYIFKVEAEGYRPYVTRIVNEDEGGVNFDIALQPGGDAKLTVLAPNGEPAPDVDVAFSRPSSMIHLNGRGLDRHIGVPIHSTDSKGQVSASDEQPAKIVAAGASGFAMIKADEVGPDRVIRLQSWGHLEGKVTRRDKGVAGWRIHVGSNFHRDRVTLNTVDTETDSEGNYGIQFVPPGHFDLLRMAPTSEAGTYSSVVLRDLQIAPGETTTADYQEEGATVQLRVQWPRGFARDANTKIFCSGSTMMARPSPDEIADPAALARWRERPDVKEMLARARHCELSPSESDPDLWTAENLSPGDWTIGATVIDQKQNAIPGERVRTLLVGSINIRIPENVLEEKLNGGVLVLKAPDLGTNVTQ